MLRRLRTSMVALVLVVAGVPVALFAMATPAGAVDVSSEAELDTAFSDGSVTEIFVTQSITLTCAVGQLERNEDTNPLVVEGTGTSPFFPFITQTCASNRVALQSGTAPIEFRNIGLEGGRSNSGGGAVKSNGDVTLTGAGLSDNQALTSSGGAVQSAGTITVVRSWLNFNHSTGLGSGGAFDSDAGVDVTSSTINSNSAGGSGGAIRSFGPIVVRSSVLEGNSIQGLTGGGGAIDGSQSDLVELVNSTFTQNTALAGAGGAVVAHDLHLVYSDVVDNAAGAGANLAWDGELESFGSVVARPRGGGANCSTTASTSSAGYNFSDDASCGFVAAGDRQSAGDPLLDGPAYSQRGGPTCDTAGACTTAGFLLLAGSPLLDAIPPEHCQDDGAAGVTTDAFDATRPQGPACDIGAVEMPFTAPAPPPPPEPPPVPPRFTG